MMDLPHFTRFNNTSILNHDYLIHVSAFRSDFHRKSKNNDRIRKNASTILAIVVVRKRALRPLLDYSPNAIHNTLNPTCVMHSRVCEKKKFIKSIMSWADIRNAYWNGFDNSFPCIEHILLKYPHHITISHHINNKMVHFIWIYFFFFSGFDFFRKYGIYYGIY